MYIIKGNIPRVPPFSLWKNGFVSFQLHQSWHVELSNFRDVEMWGSLSKLWTFQSYRSHTDPQQKVSGGEFWKTKVVLIQWYLWFWNVWDFPTKKHWMWSTWSSNLWMWSYWSSNISSWDLVVLIESSKNYWVAEFCSINSIKYMKSPKVWSLAIGWVNYRFLNHDWKTRGPITATLNPRNSKSRPSWWCSSFQGMGVWQRVEESHIGFVCIYGCFQKIGDSPKWMVYNRNPIKMGWFGGYPHLRKHPYLYIYCLMGCV